MMIPAESLFCFRPFIKQPVGRGAAWMEGSRPLSSLLRAPSPGGWGPLPLAQRHLTAVSRPASGKDWEQKPSSPFGWTIEMSALISAGASWKQISGESYQKKQMAWKLGPQMGGFWLSRAVPDGERGPASRLEGASGQGGPARRVGKGAGGRAGPGPTTH